MQSALTMREISVVDSLQRRYALVISECQSEECEKVPVYGICITDGEECASLLDISSDQMFVEKLLNRFRHAGVAPDRAIMLELVEDYFEELHGLS